MDEVREAALRVAIVADLLEERWPSMDLVADMLLAHLPSTDGLTPALLRPRLELSAMTRLGRLAGVDRFVRRFVDYPNWLRANAANQYDVFHVVDHSYAHVALALPPGRTIVTCHDADAFLPLVAPSLTSSRLPLALVRRILSGLRAARHVVCPSAATRDELLHYGIVDADRTLVVPNGVHPACVPTVERDADDFIDQLLGADTGTVDILHVGTCIGRKRIDRLLDIVAATRSLEPRVRLLKAGGTLTGEQWSRARALGLESAIVPVPFLSPAQLAALYRRAAVVVSTSDREGFGLPVVEALACGTSVVATDLPVFREVGGDAVRFAAPGDTDRWRVQVLAAIEESRSPERRPAARARNIAQGSRFSWHAYAQAMAGLYRAVGAEAIPDQAPLAAGA